MALRKILTDRDPVLHKTSRPVTNFDDRLYDLLDDLKETLANAGGAGLAAPQVGILRRCVIVVDENDEMLELVNPEVIERSEEIQDGFDGLSQRTRDVGDGGAPYACKGPGPGPYRRILRGGGGWYRGPVLLP